MDIKFYNSLTKKIEKFTPIIDNQVSMYVCGPTVYGYPHIGNMRPVVVFDTLRRFFTYIGFNVIYVSNFTDVDDKIINEAIKEQKSEFELANFYIEAFKKSIHDVGSLDPNITPRVSEYIPQIIAYIQSLIDKGAAYEADGDVYFRVSLIKDYGSLSGINLDDLIAGARVSTSSKKESPLDFALWKKTDVGIKWDSPWSKGRPGWHTECCVMIDSIFPPCGCIDIHGGGYDLKFPHHENEIAQAEAKHGNKIAHYWLHNNFVNINNEKMSKSLGNVKFAKDLIDAYGGLTIRLLILSAPYRQPINFNDDTIQGAINEMNKIKNTYKQLTFNLQINGVDLEKKNKTYGMDKFLSALADDLNTSNALSELYELIKNINITLRQKPLNLVKLEEYYHTFKDMLYVLGLTLSYQRLSKEDIDLYNQYLSAKANKNFTLSDQIRQKLIEKGIM